MWDRATAKRAAVGVMTGCPRGARGALINGALVPVMAQMVTRVACLVVARMSRRERNLRVTSCPPRFDPLKNTFFIGHQRGGWGRDIGRRQGAGR